MMKKITAVVALLLLLTGCSNTTYSLENGRYTLSGAADTTVPYLLIEGDRLVIVQDMGVSYQPSGTIDRDGNKVVMETEYANEPYKWTFYLVGDNALQFQQNKSTIPQGKIEWSDDMEFVLVTD